MDSALPSNSLLPSSESVCAHTHTHTHTLFTHTASLHPPAPTPSPPRTPAAHRLSEGEELSTEALRLGGCEIEKLAVVQKEVGGLEDAAVYSVRRLITLKARSSVTHRRRSTHAIPSAAHNNFYLLWDLGHDHSYTTI